MQFFLDQYEKDEEDKIEQFSEMYTLQTIKPIFLKFGM